MLCILRGNCTVSDFLQYSHKRELATTKDRLDRFWCMMTLQQPRFFITNISPEVFFSICLLLNGVNGMPRIANTHEFLTDCLGFVNSVRDYENCLLDAIPSYGTERCPTTPGNLVVHSPVVSQSKLVEPKILWKSQFFRDYPVKYQKYTNGFAEIKKLLDELVATNVSFEDHLEDEATACYLNRAIRTKLFGLAVMGLFPAEDTESGLNLVPSYKERKPVFPSFPGVVVSQGSSIPSFVRDTFFIPDFGKETLPNLVTKNGKPYCGRGKGGLRNGNGIYFKCDHCPKFIFFGTRGKLRMLRPNKTEEPAIYRSPWLNQFLISHDVSGDVLLVRPHQYPSRSVRRDSAWKNMRRHMFQKHPTLCGVDADGVTEWGLSQVYTSVRSKKSVYFIPPWSTYRDQDISHYQIKNKDTYCSSVKKKS